MHIKLNDYLKMYKNKRVAVIGAGISNTPLINILLDAGIETTVCDRRTKEEIGEIAECFEKAGAVLRLGEHYLSDLTEDVIFRTPGLMPTTPALVDAVARGATLTSEMEAFFDICPCKTIAVTGSDGKTTTTSIIAELLRNEGKTIHVGGNIGTPLLCRADEIKPDDIAVIELSSFQLVTMKTSPNIAVVTNLSPNHLDVHNDMEEYIEAKSNIFMHQNKSDIAVFNLDNEVTRNYAKSAPADEVLFFSRHDKVTNGVYLKNGIIYESRNDAREEIMNADDIVLPGVHNIENYLAAFAAVLGIVSYETMRKTAMSFCGVKHRLEFVREFRGVKYFNDSVASSPSRTIAGLKAFTDKKNSLLPENDEKNLILIAGGKDKGIPFDELGNEVAGRVKKLVLVGATASDICTAVECAMSADAEPNDSYELEIIKCDSFEDAVDTASKVADVGDVVLLSPACTSFDMFKNFEERGDRFKDLVNKLM
ncbi:MAG: UDP-N-acetylmuramoyl-L-alanine--D-glutamate ligase [Oscillospiraceae bacterium]|nr:UDP-N-acetylmuramoyl-L-alanine--D-glutamate ligase [Oscillospiraceae bacterium]